MKQKMGLKIAVDFVMTIVLLFLMTYELIGAAVHEWLGVGMFVLFIVHHSLNGKWIRNLLKGRYTFLRILQTILVTGVFLTMVGSAWSGVILSRYAFSFLPIKGGRALARIIHMLSAYWGFVWMSLHIGFHWSMMVEIAKRSVKKSSMTCQWILRAVAAGIAGYGGYAFAKREIGSYMTLKNHFVFLDFEEPVLFFLVDYLAVMGLFVWIGYYFLEGAKRIAVSRKSR